MSELIHLELKYCERCGGLLLRRCGLDINYCKPCQRVERALPPALPRNPGPAVVLPFPPASARPAASVPDVQACCAEEHA